MLLTTRVIDQPVRAVGTILQNSRTMTLNTLAETYRNCTRWLLRCWCTRPGRAYWSMFPSDRIPPSGEKPCVKRGRPHPSLRHLRPVSRLHRCVRTRAVRSVPGQRP